MQQKNNERVWGGQIIRWIHEEIRDGKTIYEDAINDAGIKLESGKTKFPDILLFIDKISGIIFNGWELKFPDTPVDDHEMLLNALEKAERIKSDSFVTWNGTKAIIWKIENNTYSISNIYKIKEYPKEDNINTIDDLADPIKYRKYEPLLRERLNQILHDLEQFYISGELKDAINVSGNFIEAVKKTAEIILPHFLDEIVRLKGTDSSFREEFNQWKIYEHSTFKILASSSRRPENVIEEEVLAKFTFYNLIGKIIFYLTLSENLSGSLRKLDLNTPKNVKKVLEEYFEAAGKIDYQAIFRPYFTDVINFSPTVNKALFALFQEITEFDFKVLPTDVIGTILENLVPKEEKQKFGQYFTPTTLANLVAFPAIKTTNDFVFDPTSGTGTFLNSVYHILNYYGNKDHVRLLSQIWGNDISHFPAILSVINLYKQKIKNQPDNFPRITRDDYFNLEPGMNVVFPDSNDYKKKIEQPIPLFDAIVSNFPFVQQEDIPNNVLTSFFREKFESKQKAFLKDKSFKINERSDYFTYCFYNSIRFLKKEGFLSAITSNAWLGKEYGFQFKRFLLDNFHIKYVVKSSAEHWFSTSKAATIFTVLQYSQSKAPTKFITINSKLDKTFNQEHILTQFKEIENFYIDIDNCNNPKNSGWRIDKTFQTLFHKTDGSISASIVSHEQLSNSFTKQENWDTYFTSPALFDVFESKQTKLHPHIIEVIRGERTGWNEMYIIKASEVTETKIEKEFLTPYVKGHDELNTISFDNKFKNYLFTCNIPQSDLKKYYKGTYYWIKKFENVLNKNNTKTIKQKGFDDGHKPYWYSLQPKSADIITAINPYERFFFSYSKTPFIIDQRLVAITVNRNYDIELIAALLNCIHTYITIEMRGTSRNLGALDLNANYFKKLQILNPDLLSTTSINEIKTAFQPLKKREIKTIFEEINQSDRINFDKTVLKAFGIDQSILPSLYQLLYSSVADRVTMKGK